jgi:mannose-6-phosphate isomerase class I
MTLGATTSWRKTSQALAPVHHDPMPAGAYDIYPGFPIQDGHISVGFPALAARIASESTIIIDGQIGSLWEDFRERLEQELQKLGINAAWHSVSTAHLPESQINGLIAPYLGGDDPIFGKRFTGDLVEFFDPSKVHALPASEADINIVYGCGAALSSWSGFLIYLDVPKNEIQFRSRAGSITNLGTRTPADPKVMYKRFYFIDWVVLRKHAAKLLPNIDLFVDAQRPETPVIVDGNTLRASLDAMSQNYFRARPWFEPGAWGGQWIKQHIPQLPQDAPNYAWSFELISPENGLMLRDGNTLVEVSFDFLMFHAYRRVLGASAERFGYEFPIRFDFLDTFDGGNLSVQCHPSPDYACQHFGENFTQDETYYILDCEPGARVYVGFKDGIDRNEFRRVLDGSFANGTEVDIDRYVNSEAASRGDLFLIPHGTIHCAGVNNLVLEISATPYIFTFKMYDWMRLDLDGRPRPLNIARAFENLNFERQGARVHAELIAKPHVIDSGSDWTVIHLSTHVDHFYDVHRLEFSSSINVETHDSPHVLSLVEGETVLVEVEAGMSARFSFAETFVIPAAAGRYRLTSENGRPLKVVKGFMKP